jgi:hypothetical protein
LSRHPSIRLPGGVRIVCVPRISTTKVTLLFAVALSLGLLAIARAAPPGPRLASSAPSALTIGWSTHARVTLRFRRHGQHAWQRRHPSSRVMSFTIGGLAAATSYDVELGTCHGARCSWSRALHARTVGLPPAGGPYPYGVGTGGCKLLPADNSLHRDVSAAPVDPNSGAYLNSIGASLHLHPDFGSNLSYGIPYTVVPAGQPLVPIRFVAYGSESDPGPYPVPPGAPVEGAGQPGDRHVLVLQSGTCRLFELYNAAQRADNSWSADSGAVWNMNSNALRPDGWTSADAAGLPILPLLVRYDEVQSGVIDHAIRFTVPRTQAAFIHPASHFASSSHDPSLPPMGLRLRLRASFDISGFPRDDQVILTAMKRYGLIVADNGSSWYFQGATDPRWNDDVLNQLKSVPGSAFEVVRLP